MITRMEIIFKEAYVRRTFSLLVVFFVSIGLFGVSCKKVSMKDLQYVNVSANNCYQAYVKKKKGDIVLWFQVFDNVDDKAVINSYKTVSDKIEKFPAKIYKDKWVWVLINNRMEVRLIADDKAKDFQNSEELTKFIKEFDLGGMEKVTGPKMKAQELEKFIPKLGE
jgi:hypothetical protein